MSSPRLKAYDPYISRIFLALTIAYIVFLQFYRLGDLAIVQWDESRLAVNAAEMSRSGNWLVTTYENKPDLYNTKPPLMIWLQALSTKVFGINEFAIRFPSALAGLCTILLCGYILYRYRKNIYLSCIGMVLLACSKGFIQLHGSMTGDFDALLSLWMLLTFYHFYQGFIIPGHERSRRYFVLFMSLAIMTKSAAALIVFPVLGIALLLRRDWKVAIYACGYMLLSLLPFIVFCIAREQAAPGYLHAIQANDFGGRFSKALEGHHSEWHYYIVNMFDYRFNIFIWLFPVALVFSVFTKNIFYRYYAVASAGFLLFISIPKTRIHWYDMPALPLISIVIAVFILYLYERIRPIWLKSVFTGLVSACLLIPLIEKTEFIAFRKGLVLSHDHYELSQFLRPPKRQPGEKLKYLALNYDAEFFFYTVADTNISRGNHMTLKPGVIVAMGTLYYREHVEPRYDVQLLDSSEHARKLRIVGEK